MKLCLFGAAFVALVLMAFGCGPNESAASRQLNLYIWNDYLADDTVANFEKETGITVAVSNYGSNEELDSKLAPGQSGYDIVVPSASYYERQIKSGYYQRIDKAQVPNLGNLDPKILERIAVHDPGNEYAVIHMWGTTGIGYNVDKVRAALPDAPTDSWRMVFDPGVAQHFQKCGIAVLDSASEMFGMVLAYRGKTATSQHPEELTAAGDTLMGVRPMVRYIDTQRMIADLTNGDICVAVGYSGDILQARNRAIESRTGQTIAYSIPKEGSLSWFDSYLIPADAPHAHNAHRFINYMLRPDVIAAVTNKMFYANANVAATAHVAPAVLNDPGVYPPPAVRARLTPHLADSEGTTRIMTRLWQRFMTGR